MILDTHNTTDSIAPSSEYVNLLAYIQVPSPVWSPFYLSVVDNLVNRNGILNFFHDHLRKAVEAKYLPSDEEKKHGYIKVADYFARRPVDARAVSMFYSFTHRWRHRIAQNYQMAT